MYLTYRYSKVGYITLCPVALFILASQATAKACLFHDPECRVKFTLHSVWVLAAQKKSDY